MKIAAYKVSIIICGRINLSLCYIGNHQLLNYLELSGPRILCAPRLDINKCDYSLNEHKAKKKNQEVQHRSRVIAHRERVETFKVQKTPPMILLGGKMNILKLPKADRLRNNDPSLLLFKNWLPAAFTAIPALTFSNIYN